MKFKYKLLYSIVFLLSGTSIVAQQNMLPGKAKSPEVIPLAGVNVIIEETGKGALTDIDANYSIDLIEKK